MVRQASEALGFPEGLKIVVDGATRHIDCNPAACEGYPIRAKCTVKERGRYVYRMDHDIVLNRKMNENTLNRPDSG